MRIFEFISTYCQDLIDNYSKEKDLIDLSEFAHDDIIVDSQGFKIPVIIVDNTNIPVSDFLTLDRDDFLKIWKLDSAAEVFDNYLSAFEILEGEEALSRVRHAILQERVRLEQDVELITEI